MLRGHSQATLIVRKFSGAARAANPELGKSQQSGGTVLMYGGLTHSMNDMGGSAA
jgi:hypothetical protein